MELEDLTTAERLDVDRWLAGHALWDDLTEATQQYIDEHEDD